MRRLLGLALLLAPWATPVAAAERQLLVAPVSTDAELRSDEPPHLVRYEPTRRAPSPAPLLVWLPGTGGKPVTAPADFFDTALQQGYRVLALSYLNTPAVGQVCVGRVLRAHLHCAQDMRQQRVWGDAPTSLIEDRAVDAIVPRLSRLLQYLARQDAQAQWQQYLDEAQQPRWEYVVLAGQSQGGGMAAFIAQTRRVAGVLLFSGGWDRGADGDIARWYGREPLTPPQRWHATFHVDERQAPTMAQIYRRLGIPRAQIHALSLPPLRGNAHTDAIANPAYRALWSEMLKIEP